jgi:EmrB/QacA subfamily drug resistance transporter
VSNPSTTAPAAAGSAGGAHSVARPSAEFTHRQILTILAGLMMGMFLAALDQTIMATATRTIADDLNGFNLQAWATTAFLITSTISTPLYGKLSDIYGRRGFFLFAIAIFVVGSMLCGLSQNMYELASFRAIQGIGAGGLMSMALAIIGDIVPPRQRAKYQGFFLAVFGTASVIGPILGGFFAGQDSIIGITGWRWIFYLNVPIGIAAMAVVARVLHLPHTRTDHRIDWPGALFLIVGLVPLLTVAEQGREWGWDSPRSVAAYVVGGLGLVAFYLAERTMGDAALIPLRLFRIRAAAVTISASVIVGMAMFGGIMLLPLYMQIVHGASPTQSGFLMLPMVVGMMTASIAGGRIISRTGVIRPFPIFGSALMVTGLLLLSLTTADTRLVLVAVAMFVLGFGLGNCMQPLLLIVQSAVGPSEIGVATSSATFFRQIGGTLGVAIFLSILFGGVGENIAEAIRADAQTAAWQRVVSDPSTDPGSVDGQVIAALRGDVGPDGGILAHVQDDSSIIDQMNPVLAHPFKVGFAESMDTVFLIAGGVGVLAFLVLLLMPKVELRATSAQAAVRAGSGSSPSPAAPES